METNSNYLRLEASSSVQYQQILCAWEFAGGINGTPFFFVAFSDPLIE